MNTEKVHKLLLLSAVWTALAWCQVAGISAAQSAGSERPSQLTEEVVVQAPKSAPQIWRLTNGHGHITIIGEQNFLPRNGQWNFDATKKVIRKADVLLVQETLKWDTQDSSQYIAFRTYDHFKNGHPKNLREALPKAEYERFLALVRTSGVAEKNFERFRPSIAAASLRTIVYTRHGLVRQNLSGAAVLYAQEAGIPVTQVRFPSFDLVIKGLDAMRRETDLACFDAFMTSAEQDVGIFRQYADDLNAGNFISAAALAESTPLAACARQREADAIAGGGKLDAHSEWTDEVKRELATNHEVVAVINYDDLAGPNGLLEAWRKLGWTLDKQ